MSKEFLNFKLDAILVNLRKVRILLTGHVKQSGLKKVIAGSTLSDVLSEAGGIHIDGALRRISIKSKDDNEQIVDLYQLLFEGK
ncbi:MAG: SLBB domain-containing protein [Lentisphaerales bacterium]|nr:SLBB domain-containing protein [Lentisphaerales bacterium]